jgi:glycyl-tRNA synthetase
MVSFEKQTKTHHEEKYIPNVIEPSFGLGRVIYCIFEHCFKSRENDAQRTFFDFPPLIAPLKCSILPLIKNADLDKKVYTISKFSFFNPDTCRANSREGWREQQGR